MFAHFKYLFLINREFISFNVFRRKVKLKFNVNLIFQIGTMKAISII